VITEESKRVIGYVRVSTDEQSREGVSLDVQTEKVRLYAQLHDLDLVDVIVDGGISAKTLDRPGLSRILAMLDAGDVGGVVIAKLDRLTRSVVDLGTLLDRYFGERAGKQLFSVGDSIDTRTAAGRLVLNVLMSVSQWERETIVERTRAAVDHKRSKGERIGNVPYGFTLGPDGKQLVPELGEAMTVFLIEFLRYHGWPLRKIAAWLNARTFPTKSGRPWSASTIHTLTRRS
jgi:site-specific DNA recombinase